MTKILVVDDEPDLLQLLVDDLTDQGFEVITAPDGGAALTQIYMHRPDAVLLDLTMPVLTGCEVLIKLRRDPRMRDLPVILLTAIQADEGEQIARMVGANRYVKKPWERQHLLSVIESVLRDAEISGSPLDENQPDRSAA